MGVVARKGCGTGRRTVLFIIAFVAIFLFAGRASGLAADLRAMTGIVQSVSETEIEVGGHTYNISGVPLRNASAKPVSPSEISRGTQVKLVFRGERLVRVRVYPFKMVE